MGRVLDNNSTKFTSHANRLIALSAHACVQSDTISLRCLLLMVARHRHINRFAFVTSSADGRCDGCDSAGTSMAAPIMAAAADVFRSSSLPPPQVLTSSPTTAVPAPVIVPSTPTHRPIGASLRFGDPAIPLSPAMFSANGSPLFSPEVDDDDDGNTLKLAKAAHVFSPIRVWQCAEWSRMERPASLWRCKSSEVRTREPTAAGYWHKHKHKHKGRW